MRMMFELPSFDTQYLATIGLDWETVVDGSGRWLLIHVWPVPAGYNVAGTTVALQIAAATRRANRHGVLLSSAGENRWTGHPRDAEHAHHRWEAVPALVTAPHAPGSLAAGRG